MIMPLLRAVITDVDGTLFPFGESPKVSAGNIAALQRAIDSGVHVGLATGRIPGPWRDRIRTQLPRLGASVFANGALVLSENDEIIHENTMPAAAVEAVEAFGRHRRWPCSRSHLRAGHDAWKQLAMRTTRSVT